MQNVFWQASAAFYSVYQDSKACGIFFAQSALSFYDWKLYQKK